MSIAIENPYLRTTFVPVEVRGQFGDAVATIKPDILRNGRGCAYFAVSADGTVLERHCYRDHNAAAQKARIQRDLMHPAAVHLYLPSWNTFLKGVELSAVVGKWTLHTFSYSGELESVEHFAADYGASLFQAAFSIGKPQDGVKRQSVLVGPIRGELLGSV